MISQIFRKCSIGIVAFSAMTACVSQRVTSDAMSASSASQCHSYAWAGSFHNVNGTGRSVANPLNESRLRAAIAANLSAKGVQPASSDADCLVGYGIGVQTVVQGGYPCGWGGGWGGGYYGAWGWDGPLCLSRGHRRRRPLRRAQPTASVACRGG